MKIVALPLEGAFLIDLEPKGDNRGFFARMVCRSEFESHGLEADWVQINTSCSVAAGTVRGMHFQRPPAAEVKLLRCIRGAIWDVIVDLRKESPTYAQWWGGRLDDTNRSMVYVPKGFAHGFQTLTPNVEMLYFHSAAYSAELEGGLRWNDPDVGIEWPLDVTEQSPRDANFPDLKKLEPIAV